jgi:hypothetical protein
MLLEVRLNLDVPSSVVLPDGTTAVVKALAASVVDGRLEQIVYTVEKKSGAWSEVASEDVRRGGQARIKAAAASSRPEPQADL